MQKFFENWADFLQETQKSVNFTDFVPKDSLNNKIWLSQNQLKPQISAKLAEIAKNFLEESLISLLILL